MESHKIPWFQSPPTRYDLIQGSGRVANKKSPLRMWQCPPVLCFLSVQQCPVAKSVMDWFPAKFKCSVIQLCDGLIGLLKMKEPQHHRFPKRHFFMEKPRSLVFSNDPILRNRPIRYYGSKPFFIRGFNEHYSCIVWFGFWLVVDLPP